MKQIITTNGYRAVVTNRDYLRFASFKWRGLKAKNGRIYVVRRCGQELHYLHRRIMGVSATGIDVDHKDRNGLNCLRSNLRVCNRSLNNGNARKQESRVTTSRFKGVSWFKPARMWRAYITRNGLREWLGYFHDEKKAAEAYDGAAKRLFGEFARINFPRRSKA